MSKRSMVLMLAIVLFLSHEALAEITQKSKDIAKELNSVIADNFKAYEQEDINLVMKTVHSKSPGFDATKQFSFQVFPVYDIKYEILSFKYIAVDGEYALARVKQKTSKISGPEFKDNIIDAIVIFKQENGTWKLWSQASLTIEHI